MTTADAPPGYRLLDDVELPSPAELLRRKLVRVVQQHADSKPRNHQTALGASEAGSPCDRQLALKAIGAPKNDLPRDPWAAFVGTAVHAELEKAFTNYEPDDGTDNNWRTELALDIAAGITGQCDLNGDGYVIDHKVPGDWTMDKVRACRCAPDDMTCPHISPTYKVQIQLYAYGCAQAGANVHSVAIAFWPAGKKATLDNVVVWLDDYRPAVAQAAIRRWQDILNAALELDLDHHPERAQLFATADAPCSWCPFYDWRSSNDALCRGHLS